jgi:hypothetical protein
MCWIRPTIQISEVWPRKRQIIQTQTCMLFTSSLLYSISLSLSPFPLTFLFVALHRDSSRTSCLSWKKERKIDPKFMTWLLRPVNKGLGFGPHTNDWGNIKKKTLLLRSKNQLLWEALPKALSLATCVKKKTPKEDQYARNQSKGWGGGLSFVHSKSQLIGHPF